MLNGKSLSVCVLTTSEVARDQRILKQIRTFQEMGLRVVATGYGSFPDDLAPGLEYHSLNGYESQVTLTLAERVIRLVRQPTRLVTGICWRIKSILRRALYVIGRVVPGAYILLYWLGNDALNLRNIAAASQCNFYHANDIMTLPAALRAAAGAPLVFDAHEYAPDELHLSWKHRHLINPYKAFLCWHYIPRVARMTTVCESIAELYEKRTGLTPAVIRNVPPYRAMPFRPTNPKPIRLVHHGGAMPARYLEGMIDLVALLPQHYTFTFILTPSSANSADYIAKLRAMAEAKSPGRVSFAQPVPYARLVQILNMFDVGIYILVGRNLNDMYALPNKLFEFIMAGLCVAIGPSVEMAKVVKQYDCGIVAADHSLEAVAAALRSLTPADIDYYKRKSLEAANELNAETEKQKLTALYDELLNTGSRPSKLRSDRR